MNLPLHQRFKIKGKLISLAMRINELVVKLSFKLVNKKMQNFLLLQIHKQY